MGAAVHQARIRSETGLAAQVAELVEPVIEDMGFRLVRVRHTGEAGGTLQVMAERPDGGFSIDDCVALTRVLSPLLDVADPVASRYRLEVSSPGLDRPLVRREDFERHVGLEAKVELAEPIEGRKRFRGRIEGFADGEVRLLMELAGHEGPQVVGLPFERIGEAKLVMTDELIQSTAPAARTAGNGAGRQTET